MIKKNSINNAVLFLSLKHMGFFMRSLLLKPCGRTHVRMHKPIGRSDDMLIIKGVNVFPSQIETVLLNKGYPANYQIIVTREGVSDQLEVQVEMTPEIFSDSLTEVSSREKQLVSALCRWRKRKASASPVSSPMTRWDRSTL